MSTVDLNALADRLEKIITSAQRVDPHVHAEHHIWVGKKMGTEGELKELKRRILQSAAIWAVPIVLAFIATAVWREAISAISKAMMH